MPTLHGVYTVEGVAGFPAEETPYHRSGFLETKKNTATKNHLEDEYLGALHVLAVMGGLAGLLDVLSLLLEQSSRDQRCHQRRYAPRERK
jgi:hypothetical protein